MTARAEERVPVADRLYYDSPALEFTAAVTDIRLVATERPLLPGPEGTGPHGTGQPPAAPTSPVSQLWQVSLDRTAFYPEGGGQPWDTGVLVATARSGATISVPVERVEEDADGEVWHFVRKPLVAGTAVQGRVDAERRRDHMQQHSGQHLLSAVFWSELGARTVSFHLGAEAATIDLMLPEGIEGISPERKDAVESEANRLIFENQPMTPRWHTREEAEAMLAAGQLRKLPERAGRMRIVEMAGVEFNACGGTHVAATGAIGGLLLRRVEKVKAGWRVEFLCGGRAVQAARQTYGLLSGVAAALSVGSGDVPVRVAALQEENRAAAKAERQLLDELAELHAARLATPGSLVVEAVFANKPAEFAKRVASAIARAGRAAAVGVTESNSGAVALAVPAGAVHAGNVLRAVLAAAGARGGGSAELAQGVCRGDQVQELVRTLAARVTE